jgi:hypothetical protein
MDQHPPMGSQRAIKRPGVRGLWLVTFLGFAALYLLTAQRSVSWQDSGRFQWRVLTGQYHDQLGLALSHPLYIAAGRALLHLPVGSFPGRLNFFSGLGMAVALANLAVVATLLTGRRRVGLASAAMLGVCHTVWWLSTAAEVYTWSVAGLTGELWLLVLLFRRPAVRTLVALALVSGLGWAVHNFALLPLPVYITVALVFVTRGRLPAWSLAAAAGAYLAGAAPYVAMILDQAASSGDLAGAIRSALVGDYGAAVLNTHMVRQNMKISAVLASLNFVSLLGPLAVVGWCSFRRRLGDGMAAAIGVITAIEVIFVARYPVPDQFSFLLPSLAMFAVAAAVGTAALAGRSRRLRALAITACIVSVLLPPAFYAACPTLVRRLHGAVQRRRELPFRDEARYWLVPWRHNEKSAERFAREALGQAAPDGIIVADSTSGNPLRVLQLLEGLSSGVTVQDGTGPLPPFVGDGEAFRAAAGDRPVYAVAPAAGYLPAAFLEAARFDRPSGAVLCRAHWKQPVEATQPR